MRENNEVVSKRENCEVVTREKKRGEPQVRKERESFERREKSRTNFYAKGSEVRRVIVERKEMILFLYKKSLLNLEETNPPLHSLAKSLLREFESIFLEDMPSGLPSIRGIEHQIDFILRAVIPNRPSYRNNPEQIIELQRLVEELMSKGYVSESMSPCAVPVLLVPKKDG
ncbi:uncharacterized protein LOC111379550 [Olea europaea var. sylvestris]|uniref:uncharacterized protein LOC111379550 n=1 Tax=Olea europaea var. sylvestris TaxID=158386 RepID=UPI000C1D1F10|nr:uncharacterized protein LOC111379550 [Olea europaea var. sylvestris]